jgi:uncharacterized protein (TIGR02118 family)
MFKVSVLYPKSDDSTFDMDYYREKHMAIVNRVLKPDRVEIDRAVDGPFIAVGHLYFATQEALQAGMGSPDVGETMEDIPSYTNVQPQIQISEIVE